ncbi:MAG: esterase [Ignavibacteriae bacterium HGW-Ignavibacteriae-3]|nr:MAG: esterase [Ignavibacteriae bacterium HGW-Ignavibacteriae-3]
MKEIYHKWYTQYLSRDIEMLVFGHEGYPIILFPTSKGKYHENKDFGLVESAGHLIDQGKIKIYCPDGIDANSWYNYDIHPADRVKTHLAYERMILNDVIGFAKFETGSEKVGVAGCSFGGYHAANIAFRNPDKIGYMFSMGGAFDIKQFIMGHYDDDCYFNNPFDYLPNLNDEWYLDNIKSMGIVLGTGEWDMCLQENERLSDILNSKGIEHWLDIRRWTGHDWRWWREMFPIYLSKI